MKSIKKILGASLVMISFLGLSVSCGNTSSIADSVKGSSTSSTAASSQEGASSSIKPSSSVVADKDATVASVDLSVKPLAEYTPGDVFDITGMTVNVNLSNGHTLQYFDADFTSWTHKDEPLTEYVTKITFTIPEREYAYFDFPITVAYADDINAVTVDKTAFNQYYFGRSEHPSFRTYEVIDFTRLTVKA